MPLLLIGSYMTIKKLIVASLALVIGCGAAMAADRIKVDRKAIESTVVKSPEKRNALVAKYEKGEPLTPAEMAVVYYGQAYVPGHKPAASYPDVDAAYARKDYPATLVLVDAVLSEAMWLLPTAASRASRPAPTISRSESMPSVR